MEVVIRPKNKDVRIEVGAGFNKVVSEEDYNKLKNKPSIENVKLEGNKNLEDFGMTILTNMEIESLLGL